MVDDKFYLVPSYRGRINTYSVIKHGATYELWQNSFGGQPPIYLGNANQMQIALATKANLPQ
jgi:hypothetical protein